MIAGFARRPLFAVLSAACVAVVGCQRVPLLAPTGSTLTLSSLATALPLNGSTDIVAQLLEPAGTPPHQGTHVSFTTTLGRIEPPEAETDINGRVAVKFIAGSASGTATITAASGGANTGTNGSVKIAVGAAAVGRIDVGANPTTVSAVGGTSTITASVFDASGNALAGVPVTFTTDAGSVSPSVVTTDSAGKAQSTLTTTKTAKVTATAGVATTSAGTGTGTGGTTTTAAAPSATVTVTVNTTSSVTIGTPTPATPTVGQTVSFPLTYPAGTTGASPIVRVAVDFGDGFVQTFSGQPSAVSHAYSRAGSYLVQATGFDAFGDQSTASSSVTVGSQPLPAVSISASTNPTAGAAMTFTIGVTPAGGTTNPVAIRIVVVDFGDGSSVDLGAASGTGITVQHVYQAAGTYRAAVTAADTNGTSATTATVIVVTAATTANFTYTPSNPAHGSPVTFDGSSSSAAPPNAITTYEWNFGDPTSTSNTSTGVTTAHTYNAAGTYTVTLTVTDTAGRKATTSKQITVS